MDLGTPNNKKNASFYPIYNANNSTIRNSHNKYTYIWMSHCILSEFFPFASSVQVKNALPPATAKKASGQTR